jgi:16S rRNA (uracil1498-N3)-methyltransferase
VAEHDRRRATSQVLLDEVDAGVLDHGLIVLPDDVEHHLRRVLRVRDGDSISVTDGAGRWRMAVVRLSGSSLTLEAVGAVAVDDRPEPFTLATAMPKGDRLDWLVQKTVELGVDRIVLLHAERSTVRWKADRAEKQLVRLRRIADESTRQSRRVWRTEIDGPVDADEVLPLAAVAEPGAAGAVGDESMIAIGPEGGWTDDELARSPRRVGLGTSVLRVETAAVAATTLRVIR